MHNEKTTIFIDGSSGTAGLRIYDRLAQREDIDLLTLPPELAYGARGVGPIPPDAVLIFRIRLLSVTPPAEAPK